VRIAYFFFLAAGFFATFFTVFFLALAMILFGFVLVFARVGYASTDALCVT
jgi:cell division protein FtsB